MFDSSALRKVRPDTSVLEKLFIESGLINVSSEDSSLIVKLAYSDTANFLHRDLYGGLSRAYLTCETARRLCNAQYYLKKTDSNLCLVIYDAARPMRIQQLMWDSLKMEPDRKFKYLAPPFSISLHNYGCAVDLGIVDTRTGKELDMGTKFDAFTKLSEPVYEAVYLKSGELSAEAYRNRLLLRKIMMMAGLNSINSEWWHFNACSKEFASLNYILIK